MESLENPDLEPQYVEEFSTHVMQFQNEGLPSAQGIQPVGLWLASLEHHTHDEISAATRKHLANLAKVRDPRRKVRLRHLDGCYKVSVPFAKCFCSIYAYTC